MSTITSPRDTSVTGRRVPLLVTPTNSGRPSLDVPRSPSASPSIGSGPSAPPLRRNRTALREYYNLPQNQTSVPTPPPPSSSASSIHDSEVSESALDSPSFSSAEYVKEVLETKTLGELLRVYNGVLTDIRALDAEKKALVYDNYSKLIAATETIGRMRDGIGGGKGGMGVGTLDLAVKGVFERAEGMRGEIRRQLEEDNGVKSPRKEEMEVERRRKVVVGVLETPERIRVLVGEGKREEAEKIWREKRRVLARWLERGVGGDDVGACIEDGDAALRGEGPTESSWVRIKAKRESKA